MLGGDGRSATMSPARCRLEHVLMWIVPIIVFYLSHGMRFNPFVEMLPLAQLYNLLLMELLMLFFYYATGRLNVALQTLTMAALLWGLANYYVLTFRGSPISLSDFSSIMVAGEVAGNYSYALDSQAAFSAIALFALFVFERFFTLKTTYHKKKRMGAIIISATALSGGVLIAAAGLLTSPYIFFDDEADPVGMAREDGFTVEFTINTWHGRKHIATGFDPSEAAETLAPYQGTGQPTARPNVIVIMDESFSDPAVLGDFYTSKDYMPFVHSLMAGADNTRSGYLNVSVLGGKTCNTEFEYLTGNSMYFMPRYSIPYLQYIKRSTISMASYLDNYGYETIAMHPYYGRGWKRNKVYPLLGFQSMRFQDSFDNHELTRNFTSDSAAFAQIEEEYERKDAGQPLFCFEVTMQNHSDYSGNVRYDNFTPDIHLMGADDEEADGYLSLIERSDAALKELVDYFSGVDEPTVIVFFGDHQPSGNVVESILEQNGYTSDDLSGEELLNRYKVPFIIWANYDIEEATGLETSANYLAADTLQAAGMPTDGYFGYLLDLQGSYPVISANLVSDSTGTEVENVNSDSKLMEYANLERYEVFGK